MAEKLEIVKGYLGHRRITVAKECTAAPERLRYNSFGHTALHDSLSRTHGWTVGGARDFAIAGEHGSVAAAVAAQDGECGEGVEDEEGGEEEPIMKWLVGGIGDADKRCDNVPEHDSKSQ